MDCSLLSRLIFHRRLSSQTGRSKAHAWATSSLSPSLSPVNIWLLATIAAKLYSSGWYSCCLAASSVLCASSFSLDLSLHHSMTAQFSVDSATIETVYRAVFMSCSSIDLNPSLEEICRLLIWHCPANAGDTIACLLLFT